MEDKLTFRDINKLIRDMTFEDIEREVVEVIEDSSLLKATNIVKLCKSRVFQQDVLVYIKAQLEVNLQNQVIKSAFGALEEDKTLHEILNRRVITHALVYAYQWYNIREKGGSIYD